MVWENGCVVIVMLTPLLDAGVKQCYHYWPDEGSNLYHIYEVKHRLGGGGGWLRPPSAGAHVCVCVPAGEPGVRTHLVR